MIEVDGDLMPLWIPLEFPENGVYTCYTFEQGDRHQ